MYRVNIKDKRPGPTNSTTGGKNLQNQQRFHRRARKIIEERISSGDVTGTDSLSVDVKKSDDTLHEPSFRRAPSGGVRDHLLPGNKQYIVGDTIPRPTGGAGGGGSEGSPDGEGQDDFRFAVDRAEFMNIVFDGLGLPDLERRQKLDLESTKPQRAGYRTDGSPANLALGLTFRKSLGRRIALKRPKISELEALKEEIAQLEARDPKSVDEIDVKSAQLEIMLRKRGAIPFIDPIDTRYKRFDANPQPSTNAVMFCLMDVSGSMTEHMKDLAKRYFVLLYEFLKRQHNNKVEVVFIRHSHSAEVVDEETFFYKPDTGGTVVSTAFAEMNKVIKEKYNPENINIYAAQASDGDNTASDNDVVKETLEKQILPVVNRMYYIEVGRDNTSSSPGYIKRDSEVWQTYLDIAKRTNLLVMGKVSNRKDIYPIFRKQFSITPSKAPLAALVP